MNFTIFTDPAVRLKIAEQQEQVYEDTVTVSNHFDLGNGRQVATSSTSSNQSPLPLVTWSTTKTPLNEGRLYKTDGKRRARNVESSRKYRKRRRERFQSLELANKRLQEQIEEVDRQLQELNFAFHQFVQHAECCEHCCNIRIGE
ncbi:uncharacterized protein LOC110045176 [Orbicella faveolata]|uniref:uncharacterized protein LOC110045176 n=1 Tax=Orbicella faveolata TaxID=48498 RepID=UPI0009E5C2E8|nr:uncharacterized protein LOC110045176 [Orbicella faveolata]